MTLGNKPFHSPKEALPPVSLLAGYHEAWFKGLLVARIQVPPEVLMCEGAVLHSAGVGWGAAV